MSDHDRNSQPATRDDAWDVYLGIILPMGLFFALPIILNWPT